MSYQFYDFTTLTAGTAKITELITNLYDDTTSLVSPNVEPGFLRRQLPETAPQQGIEIDAILKSTRQIIYPGILHWQSPRFFGYFPSTNAVTNVLAEMFATTFHSPAFTYAVSPSHTELENLVVDWAAQALALPEHFLMKNLGGGIINNSTTESVFVSVHAAKRCKMLELGLELNNPKCLNLVGYFGQFSHAGAQRGLMMKDIHYKRAIPCTYFPASKNYVLDYARFQTMVKTDIQSGLIPFWFGCTHGSTFSGATDLTAETVVICKKYGIWINVDAAYLGSTWICPEYRIDGSLLVQVDSLAINFSKMLLLGNGGSLFYVKNKKLFTRAMGADQEFNFYKSNYSEKDQVINYKDWTVGLNRRNNSLKFYYVFQHYGLEKLRTALREAHKGAKHLAELVISNEDIFQIFAQEYGIVCFQVKNKDGVKDNQLTKKVADKVKNIREGFCTPAQFKGEYVLRLVIGNFNTRIDHIDSYFNCILATAKALQQK